MPEMKLQPVQEKLQEKVDRHFFAYRLEVVQKSRQQSCNYSVAASAMCAASIERRN
jgi:hypothetical protein